MSNEKVIGIQSDTGISWGTIFFALIIIVPFIFAAVKYTQDYIADIEYVKYGDTKSVEFAAAVFASQFVEKCNIENVNTVDRFPETYIERDITFLLVVKDNQCSLVIDNDEMSTADVIRSLSSLYSDTFQLTSTVSEMSFLKVEYGNIYVRDSPYGVQVVYAYD